ncbi:hypothetical protein FB451DRAFT_1376632 [Mycena latifolia]|nr:hypothetical protein FB451DRAFT_1376632 [Mycena latifolia]
MPGRHELRTFACMRVCGVALERKPAPKLASDGGDSDVGAERRGSRAIRSSTDAVAAQRERIRSRRPGEQIKDSSQIQRWACANRNPQTRGTRFGVNEGAQERDPVSCCSSHAPSLAGSSQEGFERLRLVPEESCIRKMSSRGPNKWTHPEDAQFTRRRGPRGSGRKKRSCLGARCATRNRASLRIRKPLAQGTHWTADSDSDVRGTGTSAGQAGQHQRPQASLKECCLEWKNRSEFGGPENIDPNARVAASEGSKVEEPPGQPDVTSRRQARAHEAAAPRHQLADLAAEDARLRGDVAAALRLYDIPHCQLETERTAFEGRAKALQEAEERLRQGSEGDGNAAGVGCEGHEKLAERQPWVRAGPSSVPASPVAGRASARLSWTSTAPTNQWRSQELIAEANPSSARSQHEIQGKPTERLEHGINLASRIPPTDYAPNEAPGTHTRLALPGHSFAVSVRLTAPSPADVHPGQDISRARVAYYIRLGPPESLREVHRLIYFRWSSAIGSQQMPISELTLTTIWDTQRIRQQYCVVSIVLAHEIEGAAPDALAGCMIQIPTLLSISSALGLVSRPSVARFTLFRMNTENLEYAVLRSDSVDWITIVTFNWGYERIRTGKPEPEASEMS